jgi:hypothetical protein
MRYRGFGLEIASDFAIPGAVHSAAEAAPPDLTINRSATVLGPDAQDFPPYRQLGRQLELTVAGTGSYRLETTDRMLVCPEPSATAGDVSALLIASGIPMALWAREGLVLHASGVIPAGGAQAIAIAGSSGSGKSALARALLADGGTLVGDDSLWLRQQAEGITASGLPGGLFGPDTGQPERAFHPAPPAAQADTASLGAIVVLDPAQPSAPPQLLTGALALAAVLRHRHRPRMPALLGVEAERLAFAALLCAQVPVYALGGEPAALAERLNDIRGPATAAPPTWSA